VAFALEDLKIPYAFVSRNSGDGVLSYASLMKEGFGTASILINCTPIGTFPNVEEKLELPYSGINENFLLFDLIYNPEITSFLAEGQKRGAVVKNGYEMLENQAELAWEIWNK
jgi:shikimate dehydrogenase